LHDKIFTTIIVAKQKCTSISIVYFFLVGGCARHLQNPAAKCDLPIG
jgi:hypothetical protein